MVSPVLHADSVYLRFPIYSAESRSLRNLVAKVGSQSRIGIGRTGRAAVEALRGINLSLRGGDRLALIGRNGSGKTTLLKLLAGIYYPSEGDLHRAGVVTTIFDISLGLDPDATGFENIYLANYLRGLPKVHIERAVDDIVDFCELGEFIHMPVRTYSSGMATRLAFAISTAFVPDILLIDEVFGAGDHNFVEKSKQRMESLLEKARILVFASHDEALVKMFCNKALLMQNGEQLEFGDVEEVLGHYHESKKSRSA